MSYSTKLIEDRIGFFDVAISFSDECADIASEICEVCEFHSIRSYCYLNFIEDQSGLNIFEVMDFAFVTARCCLVLNSKNYGKSIATRHELRLISKRNDGASDIIVDLGGLPIECVSQAVHVSEITTVRILAAVMKSLHRPTSQQEE